LLLTISRKAPVPLRAEHPALPPRPAKTAVTPRIKPPIAYLPALRRAFYLDPGPKAAKILEIDGFCRLLFARGFWGGKRRMFAFDPPELIRRNGSCPWVAPAPQASSFRIYVGSSLIGT
jgi:hypothetical protein